MAPKFKRGYIEAELTPLQMGHKNVRLAILPQPNGSENEGKTIAQWCSNKPTGKMVDFLFLGFAGRKNADESQLLAS